MLYRTFGAPVANVLRPSSKRQLEEREQGLDNNIWDIDGDFDEAQRNEQQTQSIEERERKRDLGNEFSL